jgi:type IV pilus assembly protein PilA
MEGARYMLATRIEDAKRQDGFTLIELLVVVIIIGILAAIAIPTFLRQRERAWQRAAESDLRNAAVNAEEFFNENGSYAGFDASALQTSSPDVTLNSTTTGWTETDAYCMTADHALLEAGTVNAFLNSQTGSVTAGTACPAYVAPTP